LARILRFLNYAIALLLAAAVGVVYWYGYRPTPGTSGTLRAPVSAAATVIRDRKGVPHIRAGTPDDLYFLQGYVTAQDRLFAMDFARRQASGELAELAGAAALESDLESRRLRLRRLARMHASALTPEERAPIAAYARGVNWFLEQNLGRLGPEFRMLGYDPAPWTIADSVLIGLALHRSQSTSWRDEETERRFRETGDPEKVKLLFPARLGLEAPAGSNAWAISGRLTASGKPLLANDPHMAWTMPSIWYESHLTAPGLNAAGVMIPGLPGIGIGHNERIAWGITNLPWDQQDMVADNSPVLEQDQEIVAVRNGRPVTAVVNVTRNGPVFATEGRQAYALRWTAAQPGGLTFVFPELNKARNWEEFRRALSRHAGPAFNFVYADVEGNIGYQAAGRMPLRNAAGEWESYIPFDELPTAFNPPSGRIVTANQDPFPAEYKYPVAGGFAAPYRARQIEARLASKKGWNAAGMLEIQNDVYSRFSHFLAGQIVQAARRRGVTNPDLREPIEELAKWNGQMEPDSKAALIVTLAFQHFRRAVAERAAKGKGSLYDMPAATVVIEHLLTRRREGWFANYDEELVRRLAAAVEEAGRLQGRFTTWRYGRYNFLVLSPAVLGQIPVVGRYLRAGPVEMGGSSTTVRVQTRRLGPSMRFVADLADLDASLLTIPLGQSQHVFSGHFRDQWKEYLAGRGLPMQFGKVEAESVLEIRPEDP